jgi:hypothetical protein
MGPDEVRRVRKPGAPVLVRGTIFWIRLEYVEPGAGLWSAAVE